MQTFSGRFDVAGVMALIPIVSFVAMAFTSLIGPERAASARMEQRQHGCAWLTGDFIAAPAAMAAGIQMFAGGQRAIQNKIANSYVIEIAM